MSAIRDAVENLKLQESENANESGQLMHGQLHPTPRKTRPAKKLYFNFTQQVDFSAIF